MRKSFILLFCTLFLFSAANVAAVGLGGYFNYEMGDLTIDDIEDEGSIDFSNDKLVFGFLLDTCTARDKLFNYRLNLGVTIVDLEPDIPFLESIGGIDFSGTGFDMKHTFGFGFVRNERVRVWAGPAIKFYADVFSEHEVDIIHIGAGGGPEVGVNLHITDAFSIGVSLAYFYNFNAAAIVFDDADIDEGFTGSESMFCIQVAPIFRTGKDQYSN